MRNLRRVDRFEVNRGSKGSRRAAMEAIDAHVLSSATRYARWLWVGVIDGW